MKKKLALAIITGFGILAAVAGPHAGRGGNGGHGGRAPTMHHGGGHGGRAPAIHHGGGHHMPMRGGHYDPRYWEARPYYWDRYYRDCRYDYAPVVIGGGIVGAPIATQPIIVQRPVVTQPTVITSQPVQIPQTVWIEGRYVDQVQANGTIIRVWLPGHYEQVQTQNIYQ